jgi:hypothetical protein
LIPVPCKVLAEMRSDRNARFLPFIARSDRIDACVKVSAQDYAGVTACNRPRNPLKC